MNNDLLIYSIIGLNVLVQLALITRLRFPPGMKWKYALAAVAIPVLVMLGIRALVAAGLLHQHLAEQSALEQGITTLSSLTLVLGPIGATLAAILSKKRRAWLAKEALGQADGS
jgi:hypothetical protein